MNENKISNRAIRKMRFCAMNGLSHRISHSLRNCEGETREFFETAKNYFAENYGEDNIAYASVHLDESTPSHAHGSSAFQDGKLSSKAMFDKEELKKFKKICQNT